MIKEKQENILSDTQQEEITRIIRNWIYSGSQENEKNWQDCKKVWIEQIFLEKGLLDLLKLKGYILTKIKEKPEKPKIARIA